MLSRKTIGSTSEIETVKILATSLEVTFDGGNSICFEDCWLRDHCRCSICYHADMCQRAQHILDLPESSIVNVQHDRFHVALTWDDNHESIYNANFLSQFEYKNWKNEKRLKPILWHGGKISEKIPKVIVNKFLNSLEGTRSVFQSLLDYGVAVIEGVEPTCQATEKVCKALGGVQHTVFGGMWEFTTRADHADTAYTNLALATHHDNTYFTEAAGLQVLHCLEHSDGKGGDTILVDGFFGATRLKVEHPEAYEFLTSFDLEAEYREEGHHYKYSAPVINVDSKTKDLKQIRFNVYDRSPMAFMNSNECRSFYNSYRKLARYYQDPTNQWQFKLKPGMVLVVDNFRVLHGRTAFTGKRVLCGSYVSRSDWLDRARTLKLIQ